MPADDDQVLRGMRRATFARAGGSSPRRDGMGVTLLPSPYMSSAKGVMAIVPRAAPRRRPLLNGSCVLVLG